MLFSFLDFESCLRTTVERAPNALQLCQMLYNIMLILESCRAFRALSRVLLHLALECECKYVHFTYFPSLLCLIEVDTYFEPKHKQDELIL